MNITLHQYLEEIKAGYILTVHSLSNAIEAKDMYTKGHCERVTA
jgi:HD-GYP domain-containing protein (c-di-GMP phosphodiesterase class II)